jgi:hypothetical protein
MTKEKMLRLLGVEEQYYHKVTEAAHRNLSLLAEFTAKVTDIESIYSQSPMISRA